MAYGMQTLNQVYQATLGRFIGGSQPSSEQPVGLKNDPTLTGRIEAMYRNVASDDLFREPNLRGRERMPGKAARIEEKPGDMKRYIREVGDFNVEHYTGKLR